MQAKSSNCASASMPKRTTSP